MTSFRPTDNPDFPRSQASISGHPVHPMLITFPVTFTASVLISDIIYLLTQDAFWLRASYYLLLAALISGVAAAIPGSVDFWSNRSIRHIRAAWLHMLGNMLLLLLLLINTLSRTGSPSDDLMSGGFLLSIAGTVLLFINGWLGGELVFRHRIGVHNDRAVGQEENT